MLALIKYWREGVIAILIICVGWLKVSNANLKAELAKVDSQLAQQTALLVQQAQSYERALKDQKARDKRAEQEAVARQKKADTINKEVVSDDCEQAKEWAIQKAMDFREDRS